MALEKQLCQPEKCDKRMGTNEFQRINWLSLHRIFIRLSPFV